MKYIGLLFLVTIVFACKNEKKIETKAEQPIAAVTPQEIKILPGYPSITREAMDTMYGMIDYIDYSMNVSGMSMSQTEPQDIKGVMKIISTTPLNSYPSSCKPIGRAFFDIKGNTFLSADIYFSDSCKFLIFYRDNKPVYGNLMTQDGDTFFKNILAHSNK